MEYAMHRILQPRILEWVAILFSRGLSLTQGLNPGLPHGRQILYPLSNLGSAALVAQLVKNPFAMWETWVQSLG